MNHKTIELLLIQLEESFSRSRSNIYSDEKKETHFNELHILFSAIKEFNYKVLSTSQLVVLKSVIDYIFKGLEYLDNSTLNIIPYEIVTCLQNALKDWVSNDNFIIVTTMSNKISEYYFEYDYDEESFKKLNHFTESLFKSKVTNRLIKICLPKIHSRDYLSMVVLYHELGHFVDFELNITKKLFLSKFLRQDPNSESEWVYLNHTKEYFADLFAAQYIEDASNLYLNYIAFDNQDSVTHPSTQNRIKVVGKFLKNEICSELNELNEVLNKSGSPVFKIRYSKLDINKSDFLKLVPQKINTEQELHYVFKLGWDFWNNSDNNILSNFESRQRYHVINNLIEKTISNYTIKKIWDGVS